MTYEPIPLTAADEARWAELVRRGEELAGRGEVEGRGVEGRGQAMMTTVKRKGKPEGSRRGRAFWWENL